MCVSERERERERERDWLFFPFCSLPIPSLFRRAEQSRAGLSEREDRDADVRRPEPRQLHKDERGEEFAKEKNNKEKKKKKAFFGGGSFFFYISKKLWWISDLQPKKKKDLLCFTAERKTY